MRRITLLALAAGFLVLHLPFLASVPGNIDAVNFVLGVGDFDVSDHRPHPPGYPVYIALGKASNAAFEHLTLFGTRDLPAKREVWALALWSALFGAVATVPLFYIFRGLKMESRLAMSATALATTCPIFWFTAVRPMSDLPGLTVTLIVQALLIQALSLEQPGDRIERRAVLRTLIPGALAAGVAIGVRSQTAWLTLPLLALVVFHLRVNRGVRIVPASVLAFAGGVALWTVPLFAATGGLRAYTKLVAAQGIDDLSGADLLATNPSTGRLVRGLIETFAYPWANDWLALTVLTLSLIGFVVMLLRVRIALGLLLAMFLPYGVFHLLLQESSSVRYALPLVPPVTYLAIRGLEVVARRGTPQLTAGLSAACLVFAIPPVLSYSGTGSPPYRAFADLQARVSEGVHPTPVLAMHHAIRLALRAEALPLRVLPSPQNHEWLELVKYWRNGADAPVWLLTELGRTDVALIDPRSRSLIKSYRWPFDRKFFITGRPLGLDLWEVRRPGWVAGEGWALTPEVAGVAQGDGHWPSRTPISAFVRRRPEASILMVGGQNRGGAQDPSALVSVLIDGRTVESWNVPPGPQFFLRFIDLPAGVPSGPTAYAHLQIWSRAADGGKEPVKLTIEQFDVQSAGSVVYGFDSGWHQQEHDPIDNSDWRWTDAVATVRVRHAGRDLTLRLRADVPLAHLGASPTVSVRSGSEVLERFSAEKNLEFSIRVPAAALDRSGGVLTIETDRTFIPDRVLGNGDRRRLGLRVDEMTLE